MANSIVDLTANSKSILILLPTNPHFDQVAAGTSLFVTLSEQSETRREIVLSCPSPMLVEFNRLVGVDKITSELGNKNLLISFKDYPVEDLDKVSYEIDGGEIKIKVEPKPGVSAPKKEQVDLGYSGIAADTVILIGGAHDGHFPALSKPEFRSVKLIHIGVRDITLAEPYKPLSLAKQSSSVSEIMAELLKEAKFEIGSDIATNLLMGIEDASKTFSSPETSAETFALVAQLMNLGGKRLIKENIPPRHNFPQGSIPLRPYFQSPGSAQQVQAPETEKQGQSQEVPKSWLSQPKVYKGSEGSVS